MSVNETPLHTADEQGIGTGSLVFAIARGLVVPPAAIWQKKRYRLKFLLRSLWYWKPTNSMLAALARLPEFPALLRAQVTLPSKPHRHYLRLGLTASQRAQAVVDHYHFLHQHTGATLFQALTASEPTLLFNFSGRNDEVFSLKASTARTAEREGESTLWLFMGDELLASLTFCITEPAQCPVLFIGGVQGPRRQVTNDTIKQATKACHGLFPKRILLEVIWQLCSQWQPEQIYGVSDAGHVFRGWRYRFSKARHLHASYDEFWESVSGIKAGQYQWQLPLSLPRKELEDIASKKRAEYRRRYLLQDEIEQKTLALITSGPQSNS
ncbi:VirK/YbjX family protein [Mangrovibacter plantisponsor]|uniref:DUF535 domain-containing protein n=1 Tax=Mangrovibacter plantisponsor TaxID=451513 RepID=A0A317PYQ8_9ENTR|nr:VirK/YbjX family protein [Mangrovibacter plantisponsor]PWW08235.1 hypothetical protein DES37_107282 [Mangrovibacter plantisponsor]